MESASSNKFQLWRFADSECHIPPYGTSEHGIEKLSCKNAPVMFWPNGSVCLSVTAWLLMKYKMIPSKSARGGSAGTYASLLSHLVRYVYDQCTSFEDLNDEHLYKWAEILRAEKDLVSKLSRRRKNTQIGRIMRLGIVFLQWYQDNYLWQELIVGTASDGTPIKIIINYARRGKYKFSYIYHPAIPKNDVPEDVKPISHSIITKLYDAIASSTNNLYIRKRRQVLLMLLESTGGRRIEVSQIQTSDIEFALKSERLRLRTAKKQRVEYREVPVSSDWLKPIMLFISTHRKQLIKQMIAKEKIEKDPGALFISETTGLPLSEEYITSELSDLRRIAKIDEKACGHMFRHRFITLQVIYRLKAYIGQELPMDVAKIILVKVASITGHKNIESLMPYIDLAYQEMGVWDTAEKVLKLRSKAEAAFRKIQLLKQDVDKGIVKARNLLDQVSEILGEVLSDLRAIEINDQGMLNV
jgi:integrase